MRYRGEGGWGVEKPTNTAARFSKNKNHSVKTNHPQLKGAHEQSLVGASLQRTASGWSRRKQK